MIYLSEQLSARPEALWELVKQCGVSDTVSLLQGAEQEQRMFASVGDGKLIAGLHNKIIPWSLEGITRDKAVFASHGIDMIGIEDTAPMDLIRLGLPGRDEQIANVIEQIEAMGKLGIKTLCYNWMAVSSWARTRTDVLSRGGALVTAFKLSDTKDMSRIAEPGQYSQEQLWDALKYFLDAVIPIAEVANVRLGMHPDDPPLHEMRGMPRIMNSIENYRKLLDLYPSPSNGITLCQGNFALMSDDLPTVIREFGARDAIVFVHFRDVIGDVTNFEETFHDAGQNDLPACIAAYKDINFNGPMRPDHVPTMYGESNQKPAYETLGRLFALGYIRGLIHAVYGKARIAEEERVFRSGEQQQI
jgi:mannonate dehydratase